MFWRKTRQANPIDELEDLRAVAERARKLAGSLSHSAMRLETDMAELEERIARRVAALQAVRR